MNAQCNSCGGFFGIEKCQTCNTLICERCRTNHEIGCGQAQNMKTLGLGPTVRTAIPALIPVEPSIERPIPVIETVDGVPVVEAINPEEVAAITAILDAPVELVETAVGVAPEVIPETAVNHAGVVIVTDTPTVETQAVTATDEGSLSDALGSDILGK